jgi:hypothetical protein
MALGRAVYCDTPASKDRSSREYKACLPPRPSPSTRPIRLGAMWRASAVWKGSYDEFNPCMAPAKRSQFPAAAGADGGHRIVQRLRRQGRQTKPIRVRQGDARGVGSPPQGGGTLFPGNPQLSLDFVSRNLYVFLFPERGEGTALLRLQIRDGAVSSPLVCDPPCAIHNTGCDSGRKIVRDSGKRRMSEWVKWQNQN